MTNLADDLRRASNLLTSARTARLSALGVTPAEALLMRVLFEAGAVSPSALAERLSMTRGAITKLVDRLRAKRLLVRAAAGGVDRRYQTIALTGAGARLVPELSDAIAGADEAVCAPFTDADREALTTLLAKLFPEGDALV